MNKEIYKALRAIIKKTREYAIKLNSKKRKNQDEIFELAVLYRDIVDVENWIDELEKEHKE